MVYQMSKEAYRHLRNAKMSHNEIIEMKNQELNLPIINQDKVSVEHNNGSQVIVQFKPIMGITDIITY